LKKLLNNLKKYKKMIREQKFKKLEKEYFSAFLEKFPEYGSFLGLSQYDGKFSNQSKEGYRENIEFFTKYFKKFKAINPEELSEKEKLNRKIVLHNLKLALFSLKKLRMWESDPDVLEGTGAILFLLLNREIISFSERIRKINIALKNIPILLEQTKTRIKKPCSLWVKIAIESCEGFKVFLNNLKNIKIKQELKEEFLKNINSSIKAVENYKEFLKKDILPKAINKYIIGKDNFRKLIKLRELGLSIKEMLEIGEETLKTDKEKLKEIAKKIDPAATVKEIKEKIEKKHPNNFPEVIAEYRKTVAQIKKFLLTRYLMKIPKDEKIIIKETPSFLVHTTPFAAYFLPPKFSKKKQGIYIVTSGKQKKLLKIHNYANIFTTSTHEAYPGHHLQSVLGFKNPSLIRTLSEATELIAIELIEGWAHYCEEYISNSNIVFKKTNINEIKFIQILDEIWRAARVIIDIKLHCGEISFNEAVKFLIKETGMEREKAISEIKRYTKSPSYQLSYLIGKYLIKKLKKEIQEKMGKKYSDRFFHEVILNAGSIPIKYLKKEFELKI